MLFNQINCFPQLNNYVLVPAGFLLKTKVTDAERKACLKSNNNLFDLTASLPANYATDATVDYTEALQKGINANKDVLMPNFPILINSSGINLRDNSVMCFQKYTKLVLQPNDKQGYSVLKLNKVQNVKVYFAKIQGDKKKHLDTLGEWGFGISVRGCENIEIIKPSVKDCWGDGIYVGAVDGKISRNINIAGAAVDNSNRNGISITSVKNLKLFNCVFSNSKGKKPSSGMDIEPNNSLDEISNVSVDNVTTFNNENWGILINLVNIRKNNKIDKNIGISISNHTDEQSKYGMGIWLSRKNEYEKNVTGLIKINNVKWLNNQKGGYNYFENNNNKIKVSIDGVFIGSKNIQKQDGNQLSRLINDYKIDSNFQILQNSKRRR